MRGFRIVATVACISLGLLTAGLPTLAQGPDGFHLHCAQIFGLRVMEGGVDVTDTGPFLTGTHTYTLELDAGAYFTMQNDGFVAHNPIQEVFGLFQVYDAPALTDVDTARTTTTTWSTDTVSGGGGIAQGFSTNPKFGNPTSEGLYPAGTAGQLHVGSYGTFTFGPTTGTLNGVTPDWGFDVFTSPAFPGTTGNTGKIVLCAPVPEPVFYQLGALLGLGGLGMMRFRRKAA